MGYFLIYPEAGSFTEFFGSIQVSCILSRLLFFWQDTRKMYVWLGGQGGKGGRGVFCVHLETP